MNGNCLLCSIGEFLFLMDANNAKITLYTNRDKVYNYMERYEVTEESFAY